MTQHGSLVTLGELLAERVETEQEQEILERIKVLAQEYLPNGWTSWEVTGATKEEVFGEKVDPSVLNKLVYALPTVGLARAFLPEADHLSEKGYREIRTKMLDWAFTRALILGPPAIANRIRGSAVRTELVKQAVEELRPLMHTRVEANKILSGVISETETTSRKRRSVSSSSRSLGPASRRRKVSSPPPSAAQDAKIDALEQKMECMFSLLLEKIEQRQQPDSESDKENNYSDCDEESVSNASYSPSSWRAPALDSGLEWQDEGSQKELEFPPITKEADPLVPEPSVQLKNEGIDCQRLGTDGWNRIRYKEVEKHLRAASVFSALKVNTELGALTPQPSQWVTKQEEMLGTITHGLLLQRRALADGLNVILKRCPNASTELRQLVGEDSKFKTVSDQLLQFVCAHRSETIDLRRRAFKARNEILNGALLNIPPSPTHLFEEKQLSAFVKDNGGVPAVFMQPRTTERRFKTPFRKPEPPAKLKERKPVWRSRPSAQNKSHFSSNHVSPRNNTSAKNSSSFRKNKGKGGSIKRSRRGEN